MFKFSKIALVALSFLFALNANAAFVGIETTTDNYSVFDTYNGISMHGSIFGMESKTHQLTFDEAGRYSMSLWDKGFPEKFVQLGALLTSSDQLISGISLDTAAEVRETSEFLIEAGTYYLTTWGIADGTVGNFSLELSYLDTAQVPVPPAAILFGSALMAMLGLGRRRQARA